ncbi:hypothetical protein B0T24DRAFT_646147 [Lasiosphaeria ovina]|uniref:Oxidoreductase n=1 Tax=Lasiosphaeria ovina TaxID=92902 RepID=A0AAE0TYB4_9PEZI|nr:hypothetical protein B0T24DRAFT_646147 [Lasiosphaeria ovina]
MDLFFGRGIKFTPSKDVPSLAGKVVLVTGANNGLGKQSVLDLARYGRPAFIWLAARSPERAAQALADINAQLDLEPNAKDGDRTVIKTVELDLASLASVRAAAQRVTAETPGSRLDILMLNAGIMSTPPGLTADGYEIQFGTNHLGHALLAKLLLPMLLQTAAAHPDVRVVVLSSVGHTQAPKAGGAPGEAGIMFSGLKTEQAALGALPRYGQSKLANLLFARELARRYPAQLRVAAVDPGLASTGLANNLESRALRAVVNSLHFLYPSPADAVRGPLWAATAQPPDVIESGAYYKPLGRKGSDSPYANDELAAKLWEWTENELQAYTL